MGRDEKINPFARRAASTTTQPADVVRDAKGRVLHEGDEVILNLRGPVYLRVAKIVPVLDPGAPPNLVNIHVGTLAAFTVKKDTPVMEILRIATLEEAGPKPLEMIEPAVGPPEVQ